jgi:hypothetical protein
MLCVAFAAILFLIGVAAPKAYENFDLTVRGPIKKIKVHDDPTMEADQSEVDQSEVPLSKGEEEEEEEEEPPPEAAVGGDEKAADVHAIAESSESMEVSLHA